MWVSVPCFKFFTNESDSKMAYEKGKFYSYNGVEFVEVEPSLDKKVPVSDDAIEAVQLVRKKAQKLIGLRPELSLCVSAMLLAAAGIPEIEQRVKDLGQRFYGQPSN